jgi:hypothetical protein
MELIVAQLVNKLPAFKEPEGSLPYSEKPSSGLYPVRDKSNPNPHALFFKIHCNITLPYTTPFQVVSSFQVLRLKLCKHLSPHACYMPRPHPLLFNYANKPKSM